MGMLTRLAAWYLKSNNSNPSSWFIDWVRGGQKSASGIVVSQLRAMEAATVMACVSIRAADLAKLPVHVYRRRKDGGKDVFADHPLERLLRKPNAWQTRYEYLEQMQVAYLLKGNAYSVMPKDGRGRPVALVPANPENVSLYESPGGDLFYRVIRNGQHERSVLAGMPDLIPADDIMHLRWLSLNGLIALSRIGLTREAIGLSLAQEEQAALMLANGMRTPIVLETDKRMSDPVYERFKADIKSHWGGRDNTGEVPILEEGLKAKNISMNFTDAEFMAGREFQVREIARAFDMPPHRLGINDESGGEAIIQAHQMYLNNTLSNDAERWEAKLEDAFDIDGDKEFVEFDLDYFNRADIQTRLNALGTAVTRSIYKVNEARRKEGLPDDPKGDVIFQPANMVPLGTPASSSKPAGPGSDTTGAPAPGGDGDPAAVHDEAKSNGVDRDALH